MLCKAFITYSVRMRLTSYEQNVSRGIPDYTENYLFKGINKGQIEINNCTWENCCKLVEGEE